MAFVLKIKTNSGNTMPNKILSSIGGRNIYNSLKKQASILIENEQRGEFPLFWEVLHTTDNVTGTLVANGFVDENDFIY